MNIYKNDRIISICLKPIKNCSFFVKKEVETVKMTKLCMQMKLT